jgi:hypothetical protein
MRQGVASHVPLSCFTFTHDRCGPERSKSILADMRSHTAPLEELWLCVFRSTGQHHLAQLLRTATRAINTRRGSYVRLIVKSGAEFIWILISNVDHSARPRGGVARECDVLTRPEALAYLDYVLWHGIVTRTASRQWPLSDGERAYEGTSKSKSIGSLDMKNMEPLQEHARRIYRDDCRAAAGNGEDRLVWSINEDTPLGMDQADAFDLFGRARTAVLAQITALKIGAEV